ncbi:MAG: hypothetical protein KC729_03305 [Candidatus Eisenbacteria bacterium]|uniref:Uncharacterized protein n=1 Tax=Eiseniibacteriota bacterium TaxID=2212470 RepID=A0A956LWM1_UNCEI|nr:hypothetical protein [Candidatus Eisenbacteria bacterium]
MSYTVPSSGSPSPDPERLGAVGEALRVLQQVDSELHLERLEAAGTRLALDLEQSGLRDPARIVGTMLELVRDRRRGRTGLAARDLRDLHKSYYDVACALGTSVPVRQPHEPRGIRRWIRRGEPR